MKRVQKQYITHWSTNRTQRPPIPETVWDTILPFFFAGCVGGQIAQACGNEVSFLIGLLIRVGIKHQNKLQRKCSNIISTNYTSRTGPRYH